MLLGFTVSYRHNGDAGQQMRGRVGCMEGGWPGRVHCIAGVELYMSCRIFSLALATFMHES